MNILAIDTAAEVLSVALSAESGEWYAETDAGTRHSELLMECTDSLCRLAGLSPDKIELAACMKGPGSFTGLRIGFSAAKGLATALGIPLVSVPTLDCAASHLSIWPGLVLPVIDAKKNSFFAAFYRGGERLSDYADISAEALAGQAAGLVRFSEEPVILTGPGAELLLSRIKAYYPPEFIKIDPEFRKGRAKELLDLAKRAIFNSENAIDSGPVYLRKSDAELNNKQAFPS